MVCLDTDFLIAYLQNDADAIKKLESLRNEGIAIACTTVINVFELYKGVYRAREKQREAENVKSLIETLEVLALDREAARLAGELDASTKSRSVGEADLLIASIVMTNRETLVTRNIRHFGRVPNLAVASW